MTEHIVAADGNDRVLRVDGGDERGTGTVRGSMISAATPASPVNYAGGPNVTADLSLMNITN